MTNDDDMIIREAAREICAAQEAKSDSGGALGMYLSGQWDHTVWMRLVERGIRKGIEIGRSL